MATDKFVRSSSFTDKDVEFNAKDKSALLSNQTQSIIPQTTNQSKEIKSFDDIKNGFLQDMKQKKDEISQNNLKKSWNEKLYGKKDDSKIKINL